MDLKLLAAQHALNHVRPRTVVGLGTGSTSAKFIEALAASNRAQPLHLTCVATSEASHRLARRLGLEVVGLDRVSKIDLAVDGADCIDKFGNLIKGGGGAHAREKVVDYAARTFVVIADHSKYATPLRGPVPLEILPFAVPQVQRTLAKLKIKLTVRPGLSDNGNALADAHYKTIPRPAALESQLNEIPGVVANGVFSKNVSEVVLATPRGVEVLRP